MSRLAALGLAAVALAIGFVAPAMAGMTTGIGAFAPLSGTSTAYTTTMQIPAVGFPAASVTSDSRAGQIGVQTGASMWFGAATPPGEAFGSSLNQPYLNLRPKADTASTPSTTTYTFARTTPLGWGFVLGDIDADRVRVTAVTADGSAATATELGFESAFNICDTTPRPGSCSSSVGDVPSWDAGTQTLTGNIAASDTVGAAGWFRPTVPLKSLTFTYTARSGFPVYQTWFGVVRFDVTGTVDSTSCAPGGTSVRLLDPAGGVVASTEAATDGTYVFTGVAASPGYRVEIAGLPEGCIADGPTRVAIDLTGDDAEANFDIRALVPVPISGQISDTEGEPVAGATVSIDGPGGIRTTTTDSDGRYLFDTNQPGTYDLDVTPPDGYSITTRPAEVVVTSGTETPIIDQDFVLDPPPFVSGTVTGGGQPVAGVVVILRDGPTEIARTVTDAEGGYTFDQVAPGSYVVAVEDPPGGLQPATRAVTVADDDVTGQDLALARPGTISGTISGPGGAPVVGVTVLISGQDPVVTDAEGNYVLTGRP